MIKNNVFKFGGASIATIERAKNLAQILQNSPIQHPVVVISAIGKVTNRLEKIVHNFFTDQQEALRLLDEIKQFHFQYCDDLFTDSTHVKDFVNNHFIEAHWLLEDEPKDSYEYVYDQIVSLGEIISTTIISHYLQSIGIDNIWIDARGLIHTNSQFRNATVIWEKTEKAVQKQLAPYLGKKIIITQGFIGCTADNETTTLGREGSDFTGAILSNCIDAECLTIWKDVTGVYNCDPNQFDNAIQFTELTYREAVEMTYYGAKVIHPKTIKPLQNKSIPLRVRSFLEKENNGTIIQQESAIKIPKAIFIQKTNQILLKFYTKDFSFFDEQNFKIAMDYLNKYQANINLIQRGAVNCSFVFDENKLILNHISEVEHAFSHKEYENLTLNTLRHSSEDERKQLANNKKIYLEQRSTNTYQIAFQD